MGPYSDYFDIKHMCRLHHLWLESSENYQSREFWEAPFLRKSEVTLGIFTPTPPFHEYPCGLTKFLYLWFKVICRHSPLCGVSDVK